MITAREARELSIRQIERTAEAAKPVLNNFILELEHEIIDIVTDKLKIRHSQVVAAIPKEITLANAEKLVVDHFQKLGYIVDIVTGENSYFGIPRISITW